MRHLWSIFCLIWRSDRWALMRGAALSVVVLCMGIALLGLSGWFIIAAGAAGLAGTGAVFDVFRPSAGVRFLALGRTAARYGERLLTHDATLRALAALRVRLLTGIAGAPYGVMSRFRGPQVLNRLTADVDALDGIVLRLVIPVLAGGLTLAGTWAILAWLVDPRLAAFSVGVLAAGGAAALLRAGRQAGRPSRLSEASAQAFRVRLIDHLRGRAILAFAGRLDHSGAHVLQADAFHRKNLLKVARVERRAGALLSVTATLASAGALLIGAELSRAGTLPPAYAALGFFATLAMAETIGPLRRGVAELGRMRDAARRVARWLKTEPEDGEGRPTPWDAGEGLAFAGVAVAPDSLDGPLLQDITFPVRPGETVALAGRSGVGKSTLLNAAAGLLPVSAGTIRVAGSPVGDWEESALRQRLGYLPQRSAVISGTVADNLQLAAPEADESEMREVLDVVDLSAVAERLGGLEGRLGEGGKGLSGGETRRLALARVLLRRPKILLLDEPTEGLDRITAMKVLAGIRRVCPDSAILVAAHRAVERDWADREVFLN